MVRVLSGLRDWLDMRGEGQGEVRRTLEFLAQVTGWFGVPTIERKNQEGEQSLGEVSVCLQIKSI